MEKITSFAHLDLHPNIAKALQACGYDTPTPIQLHSIPDALEGKDLIASAQTGTGKTAAFVIPALQRLCAGKPKSSKPRILILTPTRELATQITDAAERYGKFMQCNIVSLVGGMPYRQQLRQLSRPVDMIVATPGRLMDHMQNQKVDLSEIEMLILDEADRMLDMGFIDDVKLIAKKTPAARQTLLFSATVDNKLSGIIKQLLKNPVRIDLSEQTMSPVLIKQVLYWVDNLQHKNRLLQHFLDNENIFKAIIFSATKINADRLADTLIDQGYAAAALHGDLKQNVRTRTVEQLRRGKIQYLVATDVAARGIDISDVTHVINYDLPKFSEDYVHRIGRTGRAGKSGIAISFGLPMDNKHLQRIEHFIGKRIDIQTIPGLEPTKGAKKQKAHSDHRPESRGKKTSSFRDRDFDKKPDQNKRRKHFSGGKDESRDYQPARKKPAASKYKTEFNPKQEKRSAGGKYPAEFGSRNEKQGTAGKYKSEFGSKRGKQDADSKFKSDFGSKTEKRHGAGKYQSDFGSKRGKQGDEGKFKSEFGSKEKRPGAGKYQSDFGSKRGKQDTDGRFKSDFGSKNEKRGAGKYKSEFGAKRDKQDTDGKFKSDFNPKLAKQRKPATSSRGSASAKPFRSSKPSSPRSASAGPRGTSSGSRGRPVRSKKE